MPNSNPHFDFLILSGHLDRPYLIPTLCGFHLGFGLVSQRRFDAPLRESFVTQGLLRQLKVYGRTAHSVLKMVRKLGRGAGPLGRHRPPQALPRMPSTP